MASSELAFHWSVNGFRAVQEEQGFCIMLSLTLLMWGSGARSESGHFRGCSLRISALLIIRVFVVENQGGELHSTLLLLRWARIVGVVSQEYCFSRRLLIRSG